MAKKRKPQQSVNKVKPRGFVMNKLSGGEKMQKAAYELGDGYHADMPGSTPESDKKMYRYQESADRLAGTGIDLDPDKTTPRNMHGSPVKMVDKQKADLDKDGKLSDYESNRAEAAFGSSNNPVKFVDPGMTPMATGGGFKMKMGSKENFSGTNFSSKDQSTILTAPSIMKNNYGGESVEMKDQGSPLNYGMRGETKVERKMTAAENEQYGADKKSEQKRQYLKDAMAVAQTAGNIAGAVVKSDRRLKKDIKLISVSPSGINIYNFKYKDTNNGVGEFQGVMSDEIPYDAVVSHEDGFDRVDYSKIDVEFKAL